MSLPLLSNIALILLLALVSLQMRRRVRRLQRESHRLQQERRVVVDFMHQMAVTIDEGISKDSLMQRIVNAATDSTGAMCACFYERVDENLLRPAAIEGLFPPQTPIPDEIIEKLTTRTRFLEFILRSAPIRVGQGLVGKVAQTGRAELIADAANDPRVIRHKDPSLAVHSLMAVPLRFNQRCFGVLVIANPANGRPFGRTDFELVQWIAEQAALSMHNVDFLRLYIERQRFDHDLALASNIQKMILPACAPHVAGLDVDMRYLPAQKVGGDLYDLIELPDGRLGAVVADVSGKGIPASMLMATCRAYLRLIAPRCSGAAETLRELNRVMEGEVQLGMFVTLIYVIIDPQAGQLQIARAGHELPLLLHRSEYSSSGITTDFIDSDGMPIGLVPPEIFNDAIVDLKVGFDTGDVLLLYTDGLTEAPNGENREFSGARLADALIDLRQGNASQVSEGILDAVEKFTEGHEQRDDYTLVCIKRL